MTVSNLVCCTPAQAAIRMLVAKTGRHTGSPSGLYLSLWEDMCLNKRTNSIAAQVNTPGPSCVVQAAQASHAEDTSRLQQDLESTQQQLNATQEELASHPQPEELQR